MAATPGYKGIIQIGVTPVTITGIKTADLTIQSDIFDITDLNNNLWKKKLGGLSDYSIKLAGNYDLSDAEQTAIQNALIATPGTMITWAIFPGGLTGGHSYNGTGLIKQIGYKLDVTKEQVIDIDLEGSGPLIYS